MTDYSFDEKSGKRSERMDDNCEWVTIVLKNEDESKKYEVEFFFDNNSKRLASVHLYVKKKKKGYGMANLIGLDKPKNKLESSTKQPTPTTTPDNRSGWVTVNIC